MLVLDESKQAQHAEHARYELQQEQYKQWVDQQLEHKVYIDGGDVNIANAQHQMGRVFMPDVFETKCRKLVPTLWTCLNPKNPAIRAMYAATPPRDAKGDPLVTDLIISPYPNGPLPEWSIFSIDREKIPATDIWGPEGRKNPLETAEDGWVEVKKPGMEIYRGWRTVLAYMVARRHVSPDAVEREFDAGDRLSWATHMGRREGSPF